MCETEVECFLESELWDFTRLEPNLVQDASMRIVFLSLRAVGENQALINFAEPKVRPWIDERFVEEIGERVDGDRDIAIPVRRVKLAVVLPLIAKAYGATERELTEAGRQPAGQGIGVSLVLCVIAPLR